MKQIKMRVQAGKPLISTLEQKLASKGIKNATIVTSLGALKDMELITIYSHATDEPPEHFSKKIEEKVELIGNGLVEDGKVHLHIVGGAEGGRAIAGHLVEGTVTYFVDIVVLVG